MNLSELSRRKTWRQRLVPVILAACALAQSQTKEEQAPAEKPPEASCSVRGMVVRAQGGEPIKGARVVLARRGESSENFQNYQTSTDTEGIFVVSDIVPGTYSLSVLKNGFVPQRYGQKKPRDMGIPLALVPGQKVQDIVFRLIAATTVTGRVVDEEGEPMPRVLVQVFPENPGMGLVSRLAPERHGGERTPAGQDITDDRGEYRIYGLAPGRYFVRATEGPSRGMTDYRFQFQANWEWMMPASGSAGKSYPSVLYPGVSHFDQATAVPIRAGEETAIDFRLLPQTARFSIRGKLLMPKGTTNVYVWLQPIEDGDPYSSFGGQRVVPKTDGRFELKEVAVGDYYVHGRSEGDSALHSARQKVTVADSDVEMVMALSPARKVFGRVIAEGGAKLGRRTQLFIVPVDPSPFGGKDGEVKPDGTFVFSDVEENAYRIYISTEEGTYLKSARYGVEDVLDGEFVVGGKSPGGTLQLVLSAGTAKVEGKVIDARRKPQSGAQVLLVPDRKGLVHHRLKVVRADQHGNFKIRGVAPGKYKLIASIDDETEMVSLELSIGEGESRSVELKAEEQESASANP